LRSSYNDEEGKVPEIGYVGEFFGCGSVAFPPEHREVAEKLGWSSIGISHSAQPPSVPMKMRHLPLDKLV
jgi:hypothetical protein